MDQAMMECNYAIDNNEDDAHAYFIRGEIYMAQEDFDKAIEDFNRVNKLKGVKGAVKENIAYAKKRIEIENEYNLYDELGISRVIIFFFLNNNVHFYSFIFFSPLYFLYRNQLQKTLDRRLNVWQEIFIPIRFPVRNPCKPLRNGIEFNTPIKF